VAGQHGYVYIDRESLRVMRISQQADSIPRDFPLQKAGSVLDYDFAEIGGRLFLLPLRAEVRLDAGKLQNLNEVEFHGYHKFSSNATVSFGTEAPVKK
jgi:hypothetical protein